MVIGIIGAMDEEVALFKQALQDATETVRAQISFYQGTLAGRNVVLCKSGVGKVNAAMTAQILISEFGATSVIFTGVAGALDPSLEIGDIVVSTHLQHHDIDATALGFPLGVIPFYPQSVFYADQRLVELALQSSRSVNGTTVRAGCIVSGDQFIGSREKAKQLHEVFQALCAEMEGAAVAHVCQQNGVPFVVIRSMSDKADGSAPDNFNEFVEHASNRSFEIVRAMIEHENFPDHAG